MIDLSKHEIVVDRYDFEDNEKFIEEVFELAFGDDAISRGFTREEVLERLRSFSDTSLQVTQVGLNVVGGGK